MALNYLLSPEFQIVNTAGRPASGGYLEVFLHGTRDRYYCSADWDGTLHPFQVPLDSLGGNVVLADESNAYDVYVYNRYGSLLMSRYNVHPSSGGSMGGVITSSDGSIEVTPTENGYDLKVADDDKASALKAGADTLYMDGYYSFRKKEGVGESIYMDNNGHIFFEDGWYHFSATVKLNWAGIVSNETNQIKLYTALTYDIIDFDFSYNHIDTIQLDGDVYIGRNSTQYISYGRNFILGIQGMKSGMSAELVCCDLHSITGHGFGQSGADYEGGRNISVDNENRTISFAPSRAWHAMHGSTWCDSGDCFGFLVEDSSYDPDNLITVEKGTDEDSEHNVTHWGNIKIAAGHAAIIVTSLTLLRKPDEIQPTLNSIALWYGGDPVSIYGARHEFLYDNSQSNEVVPQVTAYIPATENGATVRLSCSAGTPWYYFKPTELWVAVLD